MNPKFLKELKSNTLSLEESEIVFGEVFKNSKIHRIYIIFWFGSCTAVEVALDFLATRPVFFLSHTWKNAEKDIVVVIHSNCFMFLVLNKAFNLSICQQFVNV